MPAKRCINTLHVELQQILTTVKSSNTSNTPYLLSCYVSALSPGAEQPNKAEEVPTSAVLAVPIGGGVFIPIL